jgi:hypothetical protein
VTSGWASLFRQTKLASFSHPLLGGTTCRQRRAVRLSGRPFCCLRVSSLHDDGRVQSNDSGPSTSFLCDRSRSGMVSSFTRFSSSHCGLVLEIVARPFDASGTRSELKASTLPLASLSLLHVKARLAPPALSTRGDYARTLSDTTCENVKPSPVRPIPS